MAEEKEAVEVDPKKEGRRRPGASFPALSLPAAVKIIHEAGQHGMEHSANAFAGYCGHKTANSGPFKQKLAAFKDWNLVSVNGDRLTITDSGKDFVLADDPLTEVQFLQDAFLSCKIMKAFYDDVARGKPQKPNALKTLAVVNFRVSPESAPVFLASLAESAASGGLARLDDSGEVTFLSPEPEDEAAEGVQEDVSVDVVGADDAKPLRVASQRSANAPAVLRQVWATRGGEIVLSISSRDPLGAETFNLVAQAVGAVEALARHLGVPEEAPSDGPS